jgi:hypothetical protein
LPKLRNAENTSASSGWQKYPTLSHALKPGPPDNLLRSLAPGSKTFKDVQSLCPVCHNLNQGEHERHLRSTQHTPNSWTKQHNARYNNISGRAFDTEKLLENVSKLRKEGSKSSKNYVLIIRCSAQASTHWTTPTEGTTRHAEDILILRLGNQHRVPLHPH